MDSHVRPPVSRGNASTEQLNGYLPPSRVDLRAAYALARGVVRAQRGDPHAQRPGHRIVCVHRTAYTCSTLAAADDAFIVAGRHSQCGIVLPDDAFVALRHVLIRSIALPSGGVALRVLDLHTDAGFVLPDGSRQTAIFAEGPIAIAVGDYALVALPTESKNDELPGDMPSPQVETPPAVREQLAALATAMSPYRVNARPANHTSRITLMPCAVMVGEPMPQALGRLANGGRYAVTLAREGQTATVMLCDDDLLRGVVIGRSLKCHSEDLRRITDKYTSRVHVLLLREGGGVSAYDLASTQGMYFEGDRIRRITLGRSIALALGGRSSAAWLKWHERV